MSEDEPSLSGAESQQQLSLNISENVISKIDGVFFEPEKHNHEASGPVLSETHENERPSVSVTQCEQNRDIVEWYWINEPIVRAAIVNADREEYAVTEPELGENERILLEGLEKKLRSLNTSSATESGGFIFAAELQRALKRKLSSSGLVISPDKFEMYCYFLTKSVLGFDKITPLVLDSSITEISCYGPNKPVTVYHTKFGTLQTSLTFSRDELNNFIDRLSVKHRASSLPENLVIPVPFSDAAQMEMRVTREEHNLLKNTVFSLETTGTDQYSLVDLLENGVLSVDMLVDIWLALEHQQSVLIVAPESAKSTEVLNAFGAFIPTNRKIIGIESRDQLLLPHHENWLCLDTQDQSDLTQPIEIGQRHCPEYLIVDTFDKRTARPIFEAMNRIPSVMTTFSGCSGIESALEELKAGAVSNKQLSGLDIMCFLSDAEDSDQDIGRIRSLAYAMETNSQSGVFSYERVYSWRETSDSYVKTGNSIRNAVKERRDWNQRELLNEIQKRQQHITELLSRDFTDYRAVVNTIQSY